MSAPRAAPPPWSRPWRHPWVRHLRLTFNLFLTPLFFWGAWWASADGAVAPEPVPLLVAWIALHVFLYGGTNALNSYYDRDEGPIGGLYDPPAVDPGLLRWAWGVQLAGLPLALWVGGPFALTWLALLGVATAYSHPGPRWKARPPAALAAVGLGQGGLGALAGALAVRRGWDEAAALASPSALLHLVVPICLVLALYVVSQSYQTSEDRRRGDRTLPVLWGARTALRAAAAVGALGAVFLVALVGWRAGVAWAAAFGAFLAALGVWQLAWAARFDEADVRASFRTTMRFVAVAGVGLSVLLAALLAAPA
jgi:4-hydroxybenzoate polyprenyltransferase